MDTHKKHGTCPEICPRSPTQVPNMSSKQGNVHDIQTAFFYPISKQKKNRLTAEADCVLSYCTVRNSRTAVLHTALKTTNTDRIPVKKKIWLQQRYSKKKKCVRKRINVPIINIPFCGTRRDLQLISKLVENVVLKYLLTSCRSNRDGIFP